MGFSPYADLSRRIPDVGRSQPRNNHVAGVLVHHQAGVNAQGQATAAGREVSANYWITNEGSLLPNIDETRRAFTSGSPGYPGGAQADHRFVTVEVSNDGGPGWSISAAAEDALARLIGDVHKRYGLGHVQRGTSRGVAVHRDFVPTECPGPYVMAHLNRIITKAEQYRGGSSTPAALPAKKGKKMLMAYYKDAAGKGKARWAVFGPGFWLELSTQSAANAFAKQLGVTAYTTDQGGWDKFKRVSGA